METKTNIKAGVVPDGPDFRDDAEEALEGVRVSSGVKAGVVDPSN